MVRPWVRALMQVLAVTAGMLLGGTVYALPVLSVSEVRVQGNQRLSAGQITELADVLGANLLALDTPELQRRIMRNPWIAGARAHRRLPGGVDISVQERTAGAVWQTAGGRFLVATDGVLLEEAAETGSLPVILDADGREAETGQRVSPEAISLAYRLIEQIPQRLGVRVVSVELGAAQGMTVQTDNGWRAAFGDGSDFEQKLAVWGGVIEAAAQPKLKARFVDLRFGDRPYLRE